MNLEANLAVTDELRQSMTKRGIEASLAGVPLILLAMVFGAIQVFTQPTSGLVSVFAVLVCAWRVALVWEVRKGAFLTPKRERVLRHLYELNALSVAIVWCTMLLVVVRDPTALSAQVLILVIVVASPGVGVATSSLVGRSYECLVLPQLCSLTYLFFDRAFTWLWWPHTALIIVYACTLLLTVGTLRRQAHTAFLMTNEVARLKQDLLDAERKALFDERTTARVQRELWMSKASHELRGPLQVIVSAVSVLLARFRSQPDAVGSLERLRTAADDVLRHADDLAAMVRADQTDSLHVVKSWWKPDQTLAAVVNEYKEAAARKGLALREELCPQWVHTDAMRLRQILSNLLSNAVKYTDTGSIAVRAIPVALTDGQSALQLTVSDTGPGLPGDSQVWEPWARGTRPERGMGLGLPVVKALAQSLGATIELDSPTSGSSIVITIPASLRIEPPADESSAEQSEDGANSLAKVHVVVVDDEPLMLLSLAQMIEAQGALVTTCKDGPEAHAALAKGGADIVLIDLQMQPKDGYTVAQDILNSLPLASRPLLVACSAYKVDPALASLFDMEIPKPVGPQPLSTLLNLCARKRQQRLAKLRAQ